MNENSLIEEQTIKTDNGKVFSLKEQIEFIKFSIAENEFELSENPNWTNSDKFNLILRKSILSSLESLQQQIECDLDYFVATMHKDEYKRFIDYISIKHD